MRKTILTLFSLFTPFPLFAAIISFNSISGLIELQGRNFAGIFRDFFLYELPAFRLVLGLVVFAHFVYLFLDDENTEKILVRVVKKFFYYFVIGYFLLTNAPQNDIIYSFLEAKQVQGDAIVTEGKARTYIPHNKPISYINQTMFDYADIAAHVLYNLFSGYIYGTDGSKKAIPLLMSRAILVAGSTPYLKAEDINLANRYTIHCANKWLSHKQIKGRGFYFMDSLRDEIDGVGNIAILTDILTDILTPEGDALKESGKNIASIKKEYKKTCYDLRSELIVHLDSIFIKRKLYFKQLELLDKSLENMSDEDQAFVAKSMMNKELQEAAIKFRKMNANVSRDTSYNQSLFGKARVAIEKKISDITESEFWGSSHQELIDFFHRAPIYFGYSSLFFTIVAEVALIFSILWGKGALFLVMKCWAGYFTLKMLPVFWLIVDSIQRGFLFISSLSESTKFIQTGYYDPQLFLEVSKHMSALQETTINMISYSFLILIIFIPGVTEFFGKTIRR